MSFGITVTVETLQRDQHGDTTVVDTRDIPGCAFAPGNASEDTENKQQSLSTGTLYLPAGEEIAASSRVVILGQRWEASGASAQWVSPFTSWAPGGEVPLRRVTG